MMGGRGRSLTSLPLITTTQHSTLSWVDTRWDKVPTLTYSLAYQCGHILIPHTLNFLESTPSLFHRYEDPTLLVRHRA